MADELATLVCDKCGAKLKIKAVALKVLKDIKCGKCGAKVPIKKDPPIPTDSTPIPISSSAVEPNPPASASASSPDSGPGGDALSWAQARIKELESRVASLLDQAAQLGTAKSRIAELELRQASAGGGSDELKRAQHEIEEQSHRISELQQLWMQKEKETREAYDRADRANKERLEAVGERERTVVAIKEVLTSYHIAEIEGAKKRMAELDQRIQSFLAMARTPPA